MVKQLIKFFCVVIPTLYTGHVFAASDDITIGELVNGGQEDFHLRLLKAIPKDGQIAIGPENADNNIITFFDYKCGFCKKQHAELIEIADERNDTRVFFLQYPILSETSVKLAKLVLAAKYQNKGFEIHHALLTQKGAINEDKINEIILQANLDSERIRKDLLKPEIDEALSITSFLGAAIGARGTPAIFINNKFNPGYVPKPTIEQLLN